MHGRASFNPFDFYITLSVVEFLCPLIMPEKFSFSRLRLRDDLQTKLVIAIDFGTTYTGVAYAHSTTELSNITNLLPEQVRDKIIVVKNWPNAHNYYSEKVPTTLAYQDGHVIAWGGKVKPSHAVKISHFKLGLQQDIRQHYLPNESSPTVLSSPDGFLDDSNWRHSSLPGKKPVDFGADYLKEVLNFLGKEVLPKHFGEAFLANQHIKYVLTVPAIWTDKAINLTKTAAVRAGISEEDLFLVTEPEAAALYCSTLCNEVDLEENDRFLICDAGGGTVVSYLGLCSNIAGPHLI